MLGKVVGKVVVVFIMSLMLGLISSASSFSSSLSCRPGGRNIAGGVTVDLMGVMLTSEVGG